MSSMTLDRRGSALAFNRPALLAIPCLKYIRRFMALPFFGRAASESGQRDQIVAIDLGSRVTKAVLMQRRGEIVALQNYTFREDPTSAKPLSGEELGERLKAIIQALGAKTKRIVFVINNEDGRLCHADLPPVGVSDMRRLVRLSSKTFFQEELSGHFFDCHILPTYEEAKAPDSTAQGENPSMGEFGDTTLIVSKSGVAKAHPKVKVLVGGASGQLVSTLQAAAKAAGLLVEQITLGQVAPANAFKSMPTAFHKETVALVDIGFKTSSICILVNGEPLLNRVVPIGADRFTSGLAEGLNITYPAAERIKMVMPGKVKAKLQTLISPLAHELRASIDFFEHQYERGVSQVFVSGGSARSDLILHTLETEAVVPCSHWNPTSFLTLELPSPQREEVTKDAPQIASAIGAAMAWFKPGMVQINVLAEEQEAADLRRRDPIRRGSWLAGVLVALMVCWAGLLQIKLWRASARLERSTGELSSLQAKIDEIQGYSRNARAIERTLEGLQKLAVNRFLWGTTLNALQFTTVENIQIIRLKLEQTISNSPATKPATNINNRIILGRPATATERITLTIQAKDFSDPPAADTFIENVRSYPYFKTGFRRLDPVRLIDRDPRQVDPTDANKSFILFTIECAYAERAFRDE